MNDLRDWLAVGFLLASIAGLMLMGVDKARAQRGLWRISENTLLWIAVVGGAVGILLGMRLFHHKTRQAKFTVAVPMLLVLQLAALFYLLVS